MPFASRRQQRWAFANKKPFARRWAKETPSFAALPEKKDAGTEAGAPLHGPGGLLATPGMRKWGKRKPSVTTKPMTRSQAARVAALARWGKYTPRPGAPKAPRRSGGKRASAQVAQQREAQQTRQQAREQEREAQRETKRSQVYERMGIPPEGRAALEALRRGEQPDPEAIKRGGFVDAGLVERAEDGSYRMTPAGRALTGAADVGDVGRAGDTISGARDRLSTRRARQAAQEERKRGAAAGGRGGVGGKPKQTTGRRAAVLERRMARTRKRLADALDRARGRRVPAGPIRQTTKAQTAQDRAMFAAMGGGGKGGSGGGSKLWSRGTGGERQPTRSQAEAHYEHREARIKRRVDEAKRRKDEVYEAYKKAIHAGKVAPRRALDKARVAYNRAVKDQFQHLHAGLHGYNIQGQKSFTVFKDASGAYRWIARTTTAYRDRDQEIITTKALDADAARMTAAGQYGPLRYWHVGQPDPFVPSAPWGPGLDIGDCDYSTLIGRTSIESGTFKSAVIGRAFAESAHEYELSPGFFHPPDQPNAAGEYDTIRRFERSVVPIKYGRASNLFTGMTVKEFHMDQATYEARVKAFLADMHGKGVAPEVAALALGTMEQADKSAQQQGIAFKSDDAPPVYTAPDGTAGLIVDGRFVALKAAAPAENEPIEVETQADDGDVPMEGDTEGGGEYIGDMTPAEFWSQLSQYLAPVLKMQDMVKAMGDHAAEMKGMVSGYATKEAGTAARIAVLEAEIARLKGDQPAVTLNAEVEAALKSQGPQAPPDPNAPQIPADASPIQQLAARTMPALYQTNPQGGFVGWIPPSPS